MEEDQENPLPQEFAASTPMIDGMALLRAQVLVRLKEESGDGSMLDLLLAERVSYLYAFVRDKEVPGIGMPGGFDHLRNWRESNSMLVQMIDSLRKKRTKDSALDEARAEVIEAMIAAARKAIDFLPPAERQEVLQNMVEAFGAEG